MDTLHLYPSVLARDAALEALPDAAWTGRHLTFAEFIAELERLLPLADGEFRPRPEVSAAARLAMLAQAAAADPNTGDSAGLERVAGSERAVRAADALLAAWKGASLRPDDIREAAAGLAKQGDTSRAARTLERLAALYELYEKRLGKNWTDREGAERELLRRLAACERMPARLLETGAQVELHAFHKLGYVQFRIVEKLLRLKHDVAVDSPLYALPQQREALRALAKTFGAARYSAAVVPSAARPRTTQRMEASGPYAEVYEIGRRVARWIAEEKIPPHAIGVAFRDLGKYSQALHDVFKRLEIPFYERRGEPAQFQPLVRVALSAIDACVGGLHRRSVFRFLSAGPVDIAALAGSHARLDSGALLDLALDAGIDRVYGSGASAAVYWRAQLDRFSSQSSSKTGAYSLTRATQARALGKIIEHLESMRAARPAQAHAQRWRALFERCGLGSSRITAELTAGAALSAADTAALLKQRLALNALESALDDVAAIPGAGTEAITIETFAELLTLALGEQSVRADGTERGGVRILNFYDLRGLRFRRLAIGGLAEGYCPARPGPDLLLGQGAEKNVREALGARVNDKDAQLFLAPRLSHETEAEERALFDGALATAEELLLLSRPRFDFEGRALGPSEYWDEFSAEVETSRPIHPAPSLGDCLVPEETELRAAWLLGGGSAKTETSLEKSDDASNEAAAAVAAYGSSARLRALARRAAVERARYDYFLQQSIQAARSESGEYGVRVSPLGSAYDGMVLPAGAGRGAADKIGGTPDAVSIFQEIAAGVERRLAPRGGGNPTISPSDLERLAGCGFRFFAERLCRFEQTEEPGEEISALDAGELWHEVLARFYKEELERAAKQGRLTARLDPAQREAYLNRLLFFAGEELAKTVARKFTGHPGFWMLHEKRLRAVLGKWLDCELKEPADGFFPARVEFPFGPEAADGGRELIVPLPSDEGDRVLRIRGRIDRIDFKTEMHGGVETVVALRVLDYKFGRALSYKSKTRPESVAQLLSAQLPLYFAAAVAHVLELKATKGIGLDLERIWRDSKAGYYSLRDTPFRSRDTKEKVISIDEWPLGDARAFLDLAAPESSDTLFNLVRRRVAEVLSGNFAVHPLECGGVYCPARYTCRFQAIPAILEEE